MPIANANGGTDRNILDDDRVRRSLDVMLIAAYHQSKALSELLRAVAIQRRFLPENEQEDVTLAAAKTIEVFSRLNRIVCDTGNDLGVVRNNIDAAERVAWEAGL